MPPYSTQQAALTAVVSLTPADALFHLIACGADSLPLPGHGQTLMRWQMLAAVGAQSQALAKLFEGHTDALAIMVELGAPKPSAGSVWATWAAEPPDARLKVTKVDGDLVLLDGTKAWCSGAAMVTHALLTAWDKQGRQQLVAVELDQGNIDQHAQDWHAVGMASTDSRRLTFHRALGHAVGAPGDYTGRPGFWHGGAGVAACWLGGAQWLGDCLRQQIKPGADPHRLAHLGEVHVSLAGAANTLKALATQIDADPRQPCRMAVMQARLQVEAACNSVITHVGRALGATPFCTDLHFARLMADLPVFLRQSHAERDLASLGDAVSKEEASPWML
ncbi:acyl-CoA dehydrogenase [Pigmentiphaga aceris]|uniref:Acyl-CoA dehydrogenase n=1 Tax=Pigmentiphaga aceris TaxID=1940612 RepID=A0A5C0B2Q6_9BURK|nr:acyl-CoA dehydrogenase [Pigmentiphaga aceris]QEI07470.1 acyl-CoA dehydrogenase [Pigmentiphaga aceris]